MASLKAFEDATLWRPALRPVRTTEAASAWNTTEAPKQCTPCPASVNSPQFRTENFMMYGFKVALCSRAGRHKWDDCPFAHPTENARRRDPRIFTYSCHECPSYRNQGYCPRGDQCEYSHGVFEARLHPDSYRTVACKDGEKCTRRICFFYHNEQERRVPTGLHEARAQLVAELGESAFEINGETLRAVANNLLTSSPQLSNTMKSLNSAFTQPLCHNQTIRSTMSMGVTSPLAKVQSAGNSAPLCTAMSGLSIGSAGNSGVLMTSETVAPCLKGANKNKAKIRELAAEVGLHTEVLMNSLRISALQGELAPQSLASCAPFGTFSDVVETILQEIADSERIPLDKLRGWLLRQTTQCASPPPSPSPRRSSTVGGHFSPLKSVSPDTSGTIPGRFDHSGQFDNSGRFDSLGLLPYLSTLQRDATSATSRTVNRGAPSPTSDTSGPFLPAGNDDVIRAFGNEQQQQQNVDGHVSQKRLSWREINKAERSGTPRQKRSTKGLWRPRVTEKGTASDTKW